MKGETNGNINGGKGKVRAAYPKTVEAKQARDLHTHKNIGKIADALFKHDPFVHPSKLPDRTGKSTIRTKK